MSPRLLKWGIGFATGLCLVAAILAARVDAHWAWQALFWLLALGGLAAASWRDPLPETRDTAARAAQPGLIEGASYHGGSGDG